MINLVRAWAKESGFESKRKVAFPWCGQDSNPDGSLTQRTERPLFTDWAIQNQAKTLNSPSLQTHRMATTATSTGGATITIVN